MNLYHVWQVGGPCTRQNAANDELCSTSATPVLPGVLAIEKKPFYDPKARNPKGSVPVPQTPLLTQTSSQKFSIFAFQQFTKWHSDLPGSAGGGCDPR